MNRRPVRYKGVPVPGWVADLTAAALVLAMAWAVLGWLWELLRAWLWR